MSCISEIVSFVANLCTIAAFVIAVILWCTWKKQQNYSFTRDKIFEAEIAVSKLHTAHIDHIHKYYQYKIEDLKTTKVIDPQFYQQVFREAQNSIDRYSGEYDIAMHSLKVLDVEFSSDKIISFMMLDNLYTAYMNKLNECEDTESLTKLYWDKIFSEMLDIRRNAIAHLTNIRKAL